MYEYNLETSLADRANFDLMAENYVVGTIDSLSFKEAWLKDAQQYAEMIWDSFEIGLDVDDTTEAKDRYFSVAAPAIRDWQKEHMVDHLTEEMSADDGKGWTGMIEITPPGQKDGLNYGPVVVEIVGLEADGNMIAYRVSDDAYDQDWQMGGIEDAVEEALSQREQLATIEEEIKEEMERATEVIV